jgi:ribosomal protein S18 acetylase RimI-like enzyme
MMDGDRPEETAVVALRLRPFPADLAGVVSGWATSGQDVLMWCGAAVAPVPTSRIRAWAGEDGTEPFGLFRGQRLVAYGELWVDDEEGEVELARLIVDPAERGRGVGRRVFLRVHPANVAALRCYAAAGFEPVEPHEAAAWNVGQLIGYVWLRLAA